MTQPVIAAIILAAGRGQRAGAPELGPKQYRKLGDQTVLHRTLTGFVNHPSINHIVVVIHPEDRQLFADAVGPLADQVIIAIGDETRQQSTYNGLKALESLAPDYIHIHDGARPFVTSDLLDRLHQAVRPDCGVIPALPVSDTLKKVSALGIIEKTIARDHLYRAQTPQLFPYSPIYTAHKQAAQQNKTDFTDDASIAEWTGLAVKVIDGVADNIKLTWAEDFHTAHLTDKKRHSMFPDIRTGNGYDVHRFEEGDHVTLCGIAIPFDKKLNGHSDADVALHALTDALLATQGAGDIGVHFPPSDPQWKGAPSYIFLEHAAKIVRQAMGRIINVDITLICEAPKIGPHRDAMTALLADKLKISKDRISIKATTNEKMGFVGREEGIAAIATANVIYPGEVPA